MFDFGGVVDGYCSDFGRTIFCGDPSVEYREAYDDHARGRRRPAVRGRGGNTGARVNAACRRPIEEAGLGGTSATEWATASAWTSTSGRLFPEEETRARGRDDLHGRAVDHHPDSFAVRIEDIVVCEEDGGGS